MSTVIHVVQHLKPGGIESLVLELGRLAPSDETVRIISLEGQYSEALAAWPRLEGLSERLQFMGKPGGFRPGLILRLAALMRRYRPTAVHTHHVGPLLYAGLASRLAGVRCLVHTEHDAWHLADQKRRRLQRWILGLTRPLLVADADNVARALERYLPGVRPQVIRNGVDTQRFVPGDRTRARQTLGLPLHVRLIGCAARLHTVKGHRFLLQAVSNLAEDVHLVLAGTGAEEPDLRQRVKTAGIEGRVHFMGHVEDMISFYQSLDLFCLPSLSEGMPLSPLEAQSSGIAVVVTDTGGAAEAVCPRSGWLTTPGDADALASALKLALRLSQPVSPRLFVTEQADIRTMALRYQAIRNR